MSRQGDPGTFDKATLFASLPPPWPENLRPGIARGLAERGEAVVVLDDDPTGCQTVHGIPVLMGWSVDELAAELQRGEQPAFYVLTNSRSLPADEAAARHHEVGRHLALAAQRVGRSFAVISRSDSTLRGHFPGELDGLTAGLQQTFDACFLLPYFEEGGRFTIGDVHYVASGPMLVPAGQTEFAADASFGFRNSDLKAWVEEKTAGRIAAREVGSISLEDLRRGGPSRVTSQVLAFAKGQVVVVNAAAVEDLQVFVAALLAAEGEGRRYLCRSAASFVPVRAGLGPRPLLTAADLELGPRRNGALVMAGSHVARSSAQLAVLRSRPNLLCVELSVPDLLAGGEAQLVAALASQVDAALAGGQDVLVVTSRALVTGATAEASLQIAGRISEGLVALLHRIRERPRYLLAKGGITSHDLALRGLGVKRAMVRGQLQPGVPVWSLGQESRFPGLPYIVFPGNVGGPSALADAMTTLAAN